MAGATVDYDALAKQHGAMDSGVDYDALAKQHGAMDQPHQPPPSLGHVGDFLSGIGAGGIGTVLGVYDLLRKIPGADKVLPAVSDEVRGYAEPPDTVAAKVGKFLEQGAEFAIPGGAVADLTKGAGMAARMGAQAASAGAVRAAQTGGDAQSSLDAAALGAAGPVVGAAAGAAAKVVKQVPSIAADVVGLRYPQAAHGIRIAQKIAAAMGKVAPAEAEAASPAAEALADGTTVTDILTGGGIKPSKATAEQMDAARAVFNRLKAAESGAAQQAPSFAPAQQPTAQPAPQEPAPAAPRANAAPPQPPARMNRAARRATVMPPETPVEQAPVPSQFWADRRGPIGVNVPIKPPTVLPPAPATYPYFNPDAIPALPEPTYQPGPEPYQGGVNVPLRPPLAPRAQAPSPQSAPTPEAVSGTPPPVPQARTLAQTEAAMAQKAAPLEDFAAATRSPYNAAGDRFSSDARGVQITAKNTLEKADRYVKAISAFNEQYPEHAFTSEDLRMANGADKARLTELLQRSGLLHEGETPPDRSFPEIVKGLHAVEKANAPPAKVKMDPAAIAAALRDEMIRSGTITQ